MNSVSLLLEITHVCNLQCLYCYQSDKKQKAAAFQPPDFFLQMIQAVRKESAIQSITLLGGEPLLYPALNELISRIAALDIPVGIATNGSLLKPALVKTMISAGLSSFEFSLDAVSSDVLKALGRYSQLKQITSSLLAIKNSPASLAVNCVISRFNLNELEKVVKLCSGLMVDRILICPVIAQGSALKNKLGLAITTQEFQYALSQFNQWVDFYNQKIIVGYPLPHCLFSPAHYPNLEFGICSCGLQKWQVDPLGNVKTCEFSNTILGNLFQQPFGEITLRLKKNPSAFSRFSDLCPDCSKRKNCRPCLYYTSDLF